MQLAEPMPRWRVLAGARRRADRAIVTVISFVAMAVILALAPAAGIAVDVGKMLVATALLIPFALTFAAVGALLAGWRPRVAVVVLSTVDRDLVPASSSSARSSNGRHGRTTCQCFSCMARP